MTSNDQKTTLAYIPSSHLDLFWLGNYKTCLERGAELIKQYIDRCLSTPDETFFLETIVFAEYFLQKYPQYRDDFLRLVQERRLELGAAYVDRWETLVPGESLIRNVQLGKRWYRQLFGADNPTVTHPDLPSMIPQIAQIYSQLGLRYYVTSRKVYRHGRVWRTCSPDGSRLLVMNWPRHYVFALVSEQDASEETRKRIWIPPLELKETLKGFPLGTVAISGSAGDLAGRETFVERYGQNLEDYVKEFRVRYPEFNFGYTIPSKVLAPYLDVEGLPEHAGQIPSVWGVACDEEVRFFQRDRAIENRLLTAETMAAAAQALGIAWQPDHMADWQGTYAEHAFFARKDPISPDRAFTELWRMHVFTQDHNGGGQEGALSTFQKRVIQDRLLQYTAEIHTTVLDHIAGSLPLKSDLLLVFNALGRAWQGPVELTVPEEQWTPGTQVMDDSGSPLAAQVASKADGQLSVYVDLPAIPAVGYKALAVAQQSGPSSRPVGDEAMITRQPGTLKLENAQLTVEIDLRSGAMAHLVDKARGQDWGSEQVGQLYTLRETGNDVTLRIAPDAPRAEEELLGVEVLDSGPLFSRVLLRKQLLKSTVEQTLTLWNRQARLDVEVCIYWHGEHYQQIRMNLPRASAGQVAHGTPFYGAGWDEMVDGTGPWNGDEISPADQRAYREVHDWLHLRGEAGGLAILTNHPGFHLEDDLLSAVLIRTPPSCGDGRLFFENAGRQVFTFSLIPGAPDWRAAQTVQMAQAMHRQPALKLYRAADLLNSVHELPVQNSLLSISSDDGAPASSVTLSSLYQAPGSPDVLLRLWDTTGQGEVVTLSGPLAQSEASLADLMDEAGEKAPGQKGAWKVAVSPYEIRTVRVRGSA